MRQLKITKQITSRDTQSFNKYLTEVSSKGDVITPEEEIELTKKIREGDLDARNKLVSANLRFVISVAKQYSGMAPLGDLVNEGNLGLIKAAERFDETRGFKFISYAVWWIRQSIMQSIADDGRKIRLPQNKISVMNKVAHATTQLIQTLERQPTYYELSDYLIDQESSKGEEISYNKHGDMIGELSKYTPEKIEELMTQSQFISSLDASVTSDDDSGTLQDILPSEDDYDISRALKNKDLQLEIRRVMERLKHREREVLTFYYGLFGEEQISLEEIGEMFELTRERVRQIKETAIRKLKRRVLSTTLKEYV